MLSYANPDLNTLCDLDQKLGVVVELHWTLLQLQQLFWKKVNYLKMVGWALYKKRGHYLKKLFIIQTKLNNTTFLVEVQYLEEHLMRWLG